MTEEGPPIEDWEREGAVQALVERTWSRGRGDGAAPAGRLTAAQRVMVLRMLRVLREAAAEAEAGHP